MIGICAPRSSRGFTLVELLVVIAIIGILVALLLPAVQSAREAARNMQCKNNVKQLSLAALNHLAIHEHYPSSGWGWGWIGDPDREFGRRQPGGWLYNVLPFAEQSNTHDMALGLAGTAKTDALTEMTKVVLPGMNCPSRRKAAVFTHTGFTHFNVNNVAKHARSDYAINAGDHIPGAMPTQGPPTLAAGDDPSYGWPAGYDAYTGVSYMRSEVTSGAIRDGATNTYLLGEKYITADHYQDGLDGADNTSLYQGHDWDIMRWGGNSVDAVNGTAGLLPPRRDQLGLTEWRAFGSVHAGSCNMALCDGSVRGISYSIDGAVHARLSNRKDGQAVRLP